MDKDFRLILQTLVKSGFSEELEARIYSLLRRYRRDRNKYFINSYVSMIFDYQHDYDTGSNFLVKLQVRNKNKGCISFTIPPFDTEALIHTTRSGRGICNCPIDSEDAIGLIDEIVVF